MQVRTRVCRVTALGLAVALAGCGGKAAETTTTTVPASTATTASTSTVPAGLPTVEQLNAMMLGAGDVFSGWQLGPPVNEADLQDSVQIPCQDAAINPTIEQRLRAVTGVQFEPADGSYGHLIEFARVGEPEQLAADLETMFGAIDSCGPTFTASDGEGSGNIDPLPLPSLGDQRKGYVMRGVETPQSEVLWAGRTAHVRVGSVAITVGLLEVLPKGEGSKITPEEFLRVVQTAVDRISVGV